MKSEKIKGLAHWVHKKYVDSVLNNKYKLMDVTKLIHFKPNGLWLEVGNSWKEWCDCEMPSFIEDKIRLHLTLKPNLKLLVIDSYKSISNEWSEYCSFVGFKPKFEDGHMLYFSFVDLYDSYLLKKISFWDWLEHNKCYDGIYLTKKGLQECRFGSFMSTWDVECVIIFKPENKINWRRKK